jgi:hypothetical protein
VKYEQSVKFDEATKVAEKKEVNMEEVSTNCIIRGESSSILN